MNSSMLMSSSRVQSVVPPDGLLCRGPSLFDCFVLAVRASLALSLPSRALLPRDVLRFEYFFLTSSIFSRFSLVSRASSSLLRMSDLSKWALSRLTELRFGLD
jgi:hypothetical protein